MIRPLIQVVFWLIIIIDLFDHNDFIDFFTSVTPAHRFALHNDRRVEGVSLPTLLLHKSMIVKLADMVDMKNGFC